MKTVSYIEVQQPIGTFYLCAIPAKELLAIVKVDERTTLDDDGVQREQSKERITKIGQYCSDPDAVFPTPIVVSVRESNEVIVNESEHTISYPEDKIIGSVLDGQHRLWGIEQSVYRDKFILPVVFMFDLTKEEEAYIFATINSNQRKVNMSLIFDLYENSRHHSPGKTAHYIARTLNSQKESPFFNRLKMLGKKEEGQEKATISQGTFAKAIVTLISKRPDEDTIRVKRGEPLIPDSSLPFRDFYIQEKDTVIAKILFNCFNALKYVFPEEWENPDDYVLWKTTGFLGIIKAMPQMYDLGKINRTLEEKFFIKCFEAFKDKLKEKGKTLNSKHFPGGGDQVQAMFADLLVESLNNVDFDK